jgi:hypothetical protein
MKNKKEKIKVKAATQEEVNAIVAQTIAKLESATVGQLQATATAFAETFIELTAECPDLQTKYGLAMALLSQTLDECAGVTSIQSSNPIEVLAPLSGSTN